MFEALLIIGMALVLWRYQADSFMEKFMQPPRLLLSNRISTWLGNVSCSVYLLHLLIVIPAVALLLRDDQLARWRGRCAFCWSQGCRCHWLMA